MTKLLPYDGDWFAWVSPKTMFSLVVFSQAVIACMYCINMPQNHHQIFIDFLIGINIRLTWHLVLALLISTFFPTLGNDSIWLLWQYFSDGLNPPRLLFRRCKSLEKKEPETTAEALKNDLSKIVIVRFCLLKSLVAMVAYRTKLDCFEMSSKNLWHLWAIRTKQHVFKQQLLKPLTPTSGKNKHRYWLVGCIFFCILKCLKGATILTVVELHCERIPSVYSSVESRRMFFFESSLLIVIQQFIETNAGTATRQLTLHKYFGLVNGIQYEASPSENGNGT